MDNIKAKGYILPESEYWGEWIYCASCGCGRNTFGSIYCSDCGKILEIVGKGKLNFKTWDYDFEDTVVIE